MSAITQQQRDEFYQGFITAMLWSTGGETPPDLDDLLAFDLAPETREAVRAHCDAWVTVNANLLQRYADQRDLSGVTDGSTVWQCAGHDFWLTSAGHGVGFWDRGLGALGDLLSERCEQFEHKHDAYLGDDGLVYVSGLEPTL